MKLNFNNVFIVISAVWLLAFSYFFFNYYNMGKEISEIQGNLQEINNLNYYERRIRDLEADYDQISRQSFKSSSEFIAVLPKIGELSGIEETQIENKGSSQDNNMEITTLEVFVKAKFPSIGNLINNLEGYKIPIQVSDLEIEYVSNAVYGKMTVKIFKKIIKE